MNRRSMLGLITGLVAGPRTATSNSQSQVPNSNEFLESQLITSENPEDASMDEISSRLAWVLCGYTLPPKVRERTLLRAQSDRLDRVGPFGFRQDVSKTKRGLCFAILNLDDRNRSVQSY